MGAGHGSWASVWNDTGSAEFDQTHPDEQGKLASLTGYIQGVREWIWTGFYNLSKLL